MSAAADPRKHSPTSAAEVVEAPIIEKFALAVAKSGSDALLLDVENRPVSRVSIREAAYSGKCFAVDLADDMIGLDADKSEAARWVRDFLIGEIENRRIPFVVLNSGRSGHLHLFARVADPELKQEIETAARFARCDVRAGQRIRPPLSPHRRGFPVSLVTPANAAKALLVLASTGEQKRAATSTGRPSGRIFALLRDGDHDGRYRSRSEVVQAIALAAVNQGYSEKWVFAVLRNPANRAGEKVQTMSEAEARRYVGRSYRKAQAYAVAHPALGHRGEAVASIRAKIDRATDRILLSVGSGQAGGTHYSVLRAHLTIAWRIGFLIHGASDREVAELAGVSRPTVVKSHEWLIRHSPFLKRIRRPAVGATTASQWRIILPAESVAGFTSSVLMGGVRPTGKADHIDHTAPSADVWRWGALGKSKHRVWSLLTSPKTAREVATHLNLKVRSVWDHLWVLEELGVCLRDDDGRWHRKLGVDFDVLAQKLGVAGAGARQRALHEYERDVFRQQVRDRRVKLTVHKDEVLPAVGRAQAELGETPRSRHGNNYSSCANRSSEPAGECGSEHDRELAEVIAAVERVFPDARLVKFTQ